jgi:SAM-dependent methyltransferase
MSKDLSLAAKSELKDTNAKPAQSYDAELFDELAQVDDDHFWFVARNDVIDAAISSVGQTNPLILEIGCGNGNVLRRIEKPGRTVIGMDLFFEGLALARERVKSQLVQADASRPPFGPIFDMVGLFDVIEHLPDDTGAIRCAAKLLKPGGHLLVTVPAHRNLWSYADEVAHHVRRYSEEELTAKLQSNGFEIEYCTPFMSALLPLAWTVRRIQSLRSRSNTAKMSAELKPAAVLNSMLRRAHAFEARRVARRQRIAFGMSLLAIARLTQGL